MSKDYYTFRVAIQKSYDFIRQDEHYGFTFNIYPQTFFLNDIKSFENIGYLSNISDDTEFGKFILQNDKQGLIPHARIYFYDGTEITVIETVEKIKQLLNDMNNVNICPNCGKKFLL